MAGTIFEHLNIEIFTGSFQHVPVFRSPELIHFVVTGAVFIGCWLDFNSPDSRLGHRAEQDGGARYKRKVLVLEAQAHLGHLLLKIKVHLLKNVDQVS